MNCKNQRRWLALLLAGGLLIQVPLEAQDAAGLNQQTGAETGSHVAAEATQAEPIVPAAQTAEATEQTPPENGRLHHRVMFTTGKDVVLKEGETAEAVIVLGGSATIHGKVNGPAVAILGNLDIEGEVREAAVAVLGNLQAGAQARIHGDAVAVGGELRATEGASIGGQTEQIDFPRWLKSWFVHCVLMARPLAPQVGWVWMIAGAFFLLYLVVAALFSRPIEVCVQELSQRPATTFLIGFLSLFLVPLALVVLGATGIGLVVVPFALAALFLGLVVGKVAFVEWMGGRVGRQFGLAMLQLPFPALILGSILVALLYMVPLLGLVTFGVITLWGLGAAFVAAFAGLRKEMPERRKVASSPVAPVPAMAVPAMAGGGEHESVASFEATTQPFTSAPATGTVAGAPPVVPEVLFHPRARFWDRMGAGFLDVVLVSIVSGLVGGMPWGLVVALAYFAGMWAWKGTTIGGIVLGLKVVRQDGRAVTFAVALVRALAAAFSMVVLFLGFLWIAWDPERQGWHDRIAGTLVLKLPRGTPLV